MSKAKMKNSSDRFSVPTLAKHRFRVCAVVSMALVLSACFEQEQLPIDANLNVLPAARTLAVADQSDENGVCITDASNYIDWPILITMTDGQGTPLGGKNVSVYLDFAANTFSGSPVLELYDDRTGNSNGVVDDFELVSDVDDDIAIVRTDRFGGDRPLILRVNTTCPFRGEVFAFTEGFTARSTIDIVVESARVPEVIVEPEPEPEPDVDVDTDE